MKILKEKKWGINFETVNCPQCDERMSKTRTPDNLRQLLWGGWKCPVCGCEMDKWGKPIDEKQKQQMG
ncbi:hypothetical protein [Rhodohalobacter barkolensis]|uniref:Uncharacterized protein n=1 Tax=Rhodohalobacter barkolensis TaxID=2053187 RepID=A0A2N0VEM1_9BACT|nr:hypothetical protein [Rhodohalobacter barkolensis]PKD42641.1 hypothetical protein CWD77_14630 [Rhodohalobacter barkolensis]